MPELVLKAVVVSVILKMSWLKKLMFPRVSRDVDVNAFGEQLLEIGYMYECIILNGLIERGFDDSFTYNYLQIRFKSN